MFHFNFCQNLGVLAILGMTVGFGSGSAQAAEKADKTWTVVIAPQNGPETKFVFEDSKPVQLVENDNGPQLVDVDIDEEEQPVAPPAPGDEASTDQPRDPNLPLIVPKAIHSPSYYQVYDSIPFLRAEYDANPSYRHEATMEMLFNQLRPMVIYKNAPQPVSGPSYGLTYPYQRRPRFNYNFYYPRPTVYRHY